MAKTAPLMAAAPAQQHMAVSKAFSQHREGIMVKQTMKGCLQNCLGCQQTTEYKVSSLDWTYLNSPMGFSEARQKMPDKLYVLEDSSCLVRCCWRDGRPLTFNVTEGSEPGGPPVMSYEKPCGFPLYCSIMVPSGGDDKGGGGGEGGGATTIDFPCCCLLPSLTARDPSGQELNKSEYLCDAMSVCVPKLMYYEGGDPVYYLSPDTCCGGCCVKPEWNGCRRQTTVPFYIRDPDSKEKLVCSNGQNPRIAKVYAGIKKECCSTADTFATFWPDGIDNNRKAGLLGLTLLLDFTVFEKQGSPGSNVALS